MSCPDRIVTPFRVILALFALLLGISSLNAAGYLHASGTSILDGNNTVFLLRGVNLGNWLYNESYMTGAPFENDDWPAGLKDVLGTDTNVAVFYATWRSNYISQPDIVRVKALGFNSVRVPFDYKLFYDDATGQPINDGFVHLDNVLSWCAGVGLYAIPDMHGAPGFQRDPTGTFYFDPAKQVIASNIWRRIAARYVTNQWLGGYDLINEPVVDTQSEKWRVRAAYTNLTGAIRQVDANHLIFAEGNYYGGDLYDLDPKWDQNMAYSAHCYWTSVPNTGVFSLSNQVKLAQSANVPLWMAEFGENSNPWINAERRFIESYSVGWTVWPYKILGETVKSVEWTAFTPNYQSVLNYWKYGTNKPSQSFAYTTLIDMAQRTAFATCTENKDYMDALLRPDFHTSNIPFVMHTFPGRIYAADYDMGFQGLAYSDTIYQTTNQGTLYTPWNNAWTYRNDGVDIAAISDNGTKYYVGWIDSNEWVSFTVLSAAGRPNIALRYGSPSGARVHLELDGQNITGSLALLGTGGYFNWATTNVMANTNISAGVHALKLYFETDGLNFYWMEFTNTPPLRPAEWSDQDIGDAVRLGYSLLNANSNLWTIASSGADISGTSDQGHLVSRSFTGDGTIIARVATLQNVSSQAKAGVMFRDSSATNAMYAYVFVTPGFVGFQCRTNTNASAFSAATGGGRPPMWVRLTRTANNFTAYTSTNGVYWEQLGVTQIIPMAATATFDGVSLNVGMAATLIAEGSSWKYNDSGANLGNAWRATNYNDLSWPSGPAQLGFGDFDEFTTIATNGQITTYFRRPFTVADPSLFTNLVLRVLRDDGAVAYLNSNEVFRSNMPGTAVDYMTRASTSVPPADESTNFYSTNVTVALLVPGTNFMEVEVHQNLPTSTDLSFDLSLQGQFAPPRMSITRNINNVSLAWPDVGSAFTPYATSLLSASPVWQPLTNHPSLLGNTWTITLAPPSTPQFYRLKSP
jgi:endoglucanase